LKTNNVTASGEKTTTPVKKALLRDFRNGFRMGATKDSL
jgi:hypothetical protein